MRDIFRGLEHHGSRSLLFTLFLELFQTIFAEFVENLARIAFFKEVFLFCSTLGLGMNPHTRLFAMFVGIVPVTRGVTNHKHAIFTRKGIVKMLVTDLSNLHDRAIRLR